MYTLEYSAKQDAFHVSTLREVLSKNLDSCINNQSNDYQIIFVSEDIEKVDMYCREIQNGKLEKSYIEKQSKI